MASDHREVKEAARATAYRHKQALQEQAQALSSVQHKAATQHQHLRDTLQGLRLALQVQTTSLPLFD